MPAPAPQTAPTDSPAAPERPRCALVTGAGQRLGREIALGLARAGWDVVVHYGRSASPAEQTVAQIQALGRRALALQADLADPAAVSELFAAAQAALGPLSAIVNNASRFEPDRPETFGAAALARHMGPNLAAPLLLARHLHEACQAQAALASPPGAPGAPAAPGPTPARPARGVVINVLDQKLDNLKPDFFSYTLSKAALHSATTMLAMAFAPLLRVVAVSPGITLRSGDQTDEGFEAAHRQTPLGRSSLPRDIADAVVFLADAPAITGVNLIVDGGQHLIGLPRDVMYLTGNPPT